MIRLVPLDTFFRCPCECNKGCTAILTKYTGPDAADGWVYLEGLGWAAGHWVYSRMHMDKAVVIEPPDEIITSYIKATLLGELTP